MFSIVAGSLPCGSLRPMHGLGLIHLKYPVVDEAWASCGLRRGIEESAERNKSRNVLLLATNGRGERI